MTSNTKSSTSTSLTVKVITPTLKLIVICLFSFQVSWIRKCDLHILTMNTLSTQMTSNTKSSTSTSLTVKVIIPTLKLIVICLFSFQVSWIRKRDLHILTMNNIVYTNDKRHEVIHLNKSNSDWNLQITNSQVTDSGIYECQINTVPKMSKSYVLQVVGKLLRS